MTIEEMTSKQLSLKLPSHRKDLSGIVFGDLVVERFNYYNRHYFWLCRCKCGNIMSVREDSLLTGNTKSCGCISRDGRASKRYHDYPTPFNNLYSSYRRNARVKNLEFKLTREEIYKLTQKKCYYCGSTPLSIIKTRNNNSQDYIYNGLDRLNSDKDYIISNVVTCCKRCNYAKGKLSVDEFLELVESIYNNFILNRNAKYCNT